MNASTQWQLDLRAAELYQSVLVPWILGPAAERLVEHAAVSEGDYVLDVGCGTGAVARFALDRVGRGGRVVGLDRGPRAHRQPTSGAQRSGHLGQRPVASRDELQGLTTKDRVEGTIVDGQFLCVPLQPLDGILAVFQLASRNFQHRGVHIDPVF